MMLSINHCQKNNDIPLKLESTLQELKLWQVEIDLSCSGNDVINIFDADPLLPGVICIRESNYVGMISRSNFFDRMSRPYSLGLYSQRPIELLYNQLKQEVLLL